MDRTGNGFTHLRNKFPRISDAEINEGTTDYGANVRPTV